MHLTAVPFDHERRMLAGSVIHGLKVAEQIEPLWHGMRLQIDKRAAIDAKRIATSPLKLRVDQREGCTLGLGLELPHFHRDVNRIDCRQHGFSILFPRLRRRQFDT